VSGGLPVNRVVCGDCREVMRGWPEGCVDMVHLFRRDPATGWSVSKCGAWRFRTVYCSEFEPRKVKG
jgi:hypothetical protein